MMTCLVGSSGPGGGATRSGWRRLHCFQPAAGGRQNLGPGRVRRWTIDLAAGNLVSDVAAAGATLIKQQTR